MRPMILGAALLGLAASADAQTLAQRITAGGDGEVRFQYAARAASCGDGERYIRLHDATFFFSNRGTSMWTNRGGFSDFDGRPCRHGPAEVRLTVRDGAVVAVRTTLPAPATREGARDLGVISASEAARYFLSLFVQQGLVDDQRVLLALVLADSTRIWPDLHRVARDASLSDTRRGHALGWSRYDGDPAAIAPLTAFLRDASLSGKTRNGAVVALAHFDEPAALRALLEFVTSGDSATKLRATAVHIIGGENPEALPTFRRLAGDAVLPNEVRSALFLVLSNSDDPADGRLLRSLLPRIESEKLKDRLLHAVSERDDLESARWLLTVATSNEESVKTRRQALFWAGESDALPLADLVAVYPKLDDRNVKEHYIFVLQNRKEPQATDRLIELARSEKDPQLQKKAMFWIGQKKDPKAVAFIREVITQ